MGRLEKVIVLAVLFLVTVVLGVSLNTSGRGPGEGPLLASAPSAPEAAAVSDPARPRPLGVRDLPRGGETGRAEPAPGPSGQAPAGDGLGTLEAAVEVRGDRTGGGPQGGPVESPGSRGPTGLLQTFEGLEPAPVDGFYFYTWAAGDSFTSVAHRFYGTSRHTPLLLSANEGKSSDSLAPGDRIWVPLNAPETVAGTQGNHYVVGEGETLSSIASKVYGDGSRWQRIYDANRDTMADPDRVEVGMRLRIP